MTSPVDRTGWIGVATEHYGDHMFSAGGLISWSSQRITHNKRYKKVKE